MLGRRGQQPVGSGGDREPLRRGLVIAEAERGPHRRSMPLGQRPEIAGQRMEQRIQASEGQLRSRLDPVARKTRIDPADPAA